MIDVLWLLVILLLAYFPYKTKQRRRIVAFSWKQAVAMALWFIVFSVLLLVSGGHAMVIHYSLPLIVVFVGATVVWFAAPKLVRQWGHEPLGYIKQYSSRPLVRFELSRFLVKYFEILFQQSVFLYILFVLLNGLPISQRIVWFTVILFVKHLGNLFFLDRAEALFFSFLSIPMAIGFGIMIINGLVPLIISLHLLFYLMFYGRLWF